MCQLPGKATSQTAPWNNQCTVEWIDLSGVLKPPFTLNDLSAYLLVYQEFLKYFDMAVEKLAARIAPYDAPMQLDDTYDKLFAGPPALSLALCQMLVNDDQLMSFGAVTDLVGTLLSHHLVSVALYNTYRSNSTIQTVNSEYQNTKRATHDVIAALEAAHGFVKAYGPSQNNDGGT